MKKRKMKTKNNLLPKKITLLGEIYTIKKGKVNPDCSGNINYRNKIIIISDTLDDEKDREEIIFTFFHELCHYFSFYYRLGENTEVFANALACFIISTINQFGFVKE